MMSTPQGPEIISKTASSRTTRKKSDAPTRHHRHTTLYDAVAGRVSSEGFIKPQPITSRYRTTTSHSTEPISPEKALFRLKGRDFDGENDPYWAHRYLTTEQRLPDSDLLKAVHAYSSDFYSRNFGDGARVDFQSLNETALLCLGILLEEMADEILGETGDLAFTEGEAVGPRPESTNLKTVEMSGDLSTRESGAVAESVDMITEKVSPSPKVRSLKRRKTKHPESDD